MCFFKLSLFLNCVLSCWTQQLPASPEDLDSSCPSWLQYDNGSCTCETGVSEFIQRPCGSNNIMLTCGDCVTWDDSINQAVFVACPYFVDSDETCTAWQFSIPKSLPSVNLTSYMCSQFEREGIHCGRCKDGYGPAPFLNGANISCAKCHSHDFTWLLYLLLQLLMVTIVYFGFVFCEYRGTSSPLSVLAYFYQIVINAVTSNSFLYAQLMCATKPEFLSSVLTTFAFWNLDFFRYSLPPVCVSPSMRNSQVLLFDYIIALFPVLLTLVLFLCIKLHSRGIAFVVILWKPFNSIVRRFKKDWNPLRSILNTFATCLLLSYSKILFTSMNLLYGAPVRDNSGRVVNNSPVLYYDTSLQYFSYNHVPYIFISFSAIIIFIILPPLILLLFPTRCFKRCLECCRFRHWNSLSIIMDVFQGWYRDGTNGCCDFRVMSALYMILRICFACEFIINRMFGTGLALEWIVPSLVHIGFGCFYLTVKPYKKSWMNTVDGLVLIVLGIACNIIIVDDNATFVLALLLVSSPLIVACLYVMWKCLLKLKLLTCLKIVCNKVSARFAWWKTDTENVCDDNPFWVGSLERSDRSVFEPLQSSLLFQQDTHTPRHTTYTYGALN